MTKVVFIPGLGADERVFSLLKLEGINAVYLNFRNPGSVSSIREYLDILRDNQFEDDEPVVLVGVSLGGVMAMEWREHFPVKKTIIVSSVKCVNEIPGYLRIFRNYNSYKLMKPSWLKKGAKLVKPLISDIHNKPAIELFRGMLKDADDEFISWGIGQVLNWNRTSFKKSELVHIHGNKDHLFPVKYISKPDYVIDGGAHDMILSKPSEIAKIIMKELEGI